MNQTFCTKINLLQKSDLTQNIKVVWVHLHWYKFQGQIEQFTERDWEKNKTCISYQVFKNIYLLCLNDLEIAHFLFKCD